MSEQNIFDNEQFFEGYKSIRERDNNLNILLEQPAMARLLPDVQGKRVLDMGCGYGHNCMSFVSKGADRVIGIDISGRMLEVARAESAHNRIEYINMSMTDVHRLEGEFDLIYSSLAFHYIEDFEALAKEIYSKLNSGGCLLFSQEHPIVTSTIDGKGHFNYDEEGNRVSYTFSNYNQIGKREMSWIIDGVIKYHRPLGYIITTLAKAGFIIDTVEEPVPEQWAIEKLPTIVKEYLKPNFLIIKAYK